MNKEPFLKSGDSVDKFKVGMIFENKETYYKIIRITPERIPQIHFLRFYKPNNKMNYISAHFNDSIIKNWILIDKVPPKIVETEVEESIFINTYALDKLKESNFIKGYEPLLITSREKFGCYDHHFTEAKIKTKIAKELNFNWDTWEWE